MYPPSTTETWRADVIEWAPRIAIALVIILATWLIARAAMPAGRPLRTVTRWYRAIPEFIAGYGALLMRTGD